MTRKFSSLKDLYATLFFAGNARFDLYSSSGLIRAGCSWPDIPKSYKGAQVETLWIKELDFTGCIIDCEVHFK